MTVDLLLENARVVDGTGAPWYRGNVVIDGGTIHSVLREPDPAVEATERVDVSDAIVCPGFIDLHSHSDLHVFDDPTLSPKLRQGITTEILGQDGFSVAPLYREDGAREWREHLLGLTGEADVDWSWSRFADYLDAIDTRGVACNLGVLVGHGTVRYNVLGMDERDPTESELEAMAALVTEALEDGALGFSTGLVYPPQVNASTHEVAALAAQLAPFGRPFVAHIRSEGRWVWEAFDEFVDIGAEAGIPLHVSHFKVSGRSVVGQSARLLALFDAARDRGVDITADKYPYSAGNTMLTSVLPPWVHTGGPERMLSRLADPEARARIHRDVEGWRIDGWENNGAKTGWDNLVVTNIEADALCHLNGECIADIARERDEVLDVAVHRVEVHHDHGCFERLDMFVQAGGVIDWSP